MDYLIYTINDSQIIKVIGYSESKISAIKLIKREIIKNNKNIVLQEGLDNLGYNIIINDNIVTFYNKSKLTNNWFYSNDYIKEKIEIYYIVESGITDLELNDMKDKLSKFIFKNTRLSYLEIPDTISLKKIYDLFLNDKLFEPELGIEFNYLGLYFENKNRELAEKYYLEGINKGFKYCAQNLSKLYYLEANMNKWSHYDSISRKMI
jgi:hypothetical protein